MIQQWLAPWLIGGVIGLGVGVAVLGAAYVAVRAFVQLMGRGLD